MKKPIFTALSPNAQIDDVFLALKTLFTPWKWKSGYSIELIRRELKCFLRNENVFLFESGRSCLFAVLDALGLKKDDEVLVQAYTCIAVPEPVLWAGLKPVYVDCNENDFTMSVSDLEEKITPRSKVLIIQHTFGQPADITRLMEIAKKHRLFVIEDCAHALGATYHGHKIGTFGDASFFSFGRDKVISSVFGGAVAVKDDKIAEKIGFFHKNCGDASMGWIFQQLIHPVIMSIVIATYGIIIGKVILKISKQLGVLSLAVYRQEKKGKKPPFIFRKLPNGLAALALNQFRKLELFNNHRRKIAGIYEKNLKNLPLKLPSGVNDAESIFLRYTVKSDKVISLLTASKKEAIHLGDWYATPLAPAGVDYSIMKFDPKTCPVATRIASESLNLPTSIHISEASALKIINFLRNYYGFKN